MFNLTKISSKGTIWNMKKTLLLAAAALALAACGSEVESGAAYDESRSMAPMAVEAYSERKQAAEYEAMPAPEPMPADDGATAETGPMLAYVHNRSIEAPSNGLGAIVSEHQARCEAAGPSVCMVVNASQSGIGEEWGSANLHLKATPQWTDAFLSGLESELEGTKAKITSASTYAEDLSTQIIDTDARLKAKITLRDRLQALLNDRPSDLGDLIELERELARVQADIDSAASILAALRQRVAMSNIHMNYSALREPTAHSVWRPLTRAFGDFFGNFASALGGIVTAVAFILPWIPVGIGLIWVARSIWRRVFKKKQPASKAA